MADYYCQMHGIFAGGIPWSTGVKVTSNQSESALATTWGNAIQSMWTDGTHGVETLYPAGTSLTSISVTTLNGTMHGVTKTTVPHIVAGTATGDTLPFQESIVISLRGNGIKKVNRGRMFMPALEETFVNNNALILSAQNRMAAAIRAVWAAINADGSTFFVCPKDPKRPPKDGTPLYTKSVVTTPLVSSKPARQSRRVNKVAGTYL